MASTAPLTATAAPVTGLGCAFRAADSAPMDSAAITTSVQKDRRARAVGCGAVVIPGSHQVLRGGQNHREDRQDDDRDEDDRGDGHRHRA